MTTARCGCGAVTLSLPGLSKLIVACHCIDCQRRTGAPFGVGAFYPAATVTVSGRPKEFTRAAASGGKVQSYFCPDCGSTVYWKSSNLPAFIGVAIGAIADAGYTAPVRSVFEQSKHAWVEIGGAGVEHFQQGSAHKTTGTSG
ncbi:GFA family protein [Bradyrhizobium sp. CCGUVB1N3]|uniref:GFA family protein n=1 Tax=Bradyrhizobium sp. CCGUVB1N3 TaxID=2949629 RepID=UPI0020B2F15B|nr:GFA family protein [Bradyrhizobium sp. CCGUVB1N3]MCP3469691.1 GFA family protein [Bradyrhizobium sp. CCGUVB1N3]